MFVGFCSGVVGGGGNRAIFIEYRKSTFDLENTRYDQYRQHILYGYLQILAINYKP